MPSVWALLEMDTTSLWILSTNMLFACKSSTGSFRISSNETAVKPEGHDGEGNSQRMTKI